MLRNGGNDTELTKIREILIHRLASDLNIGVQASRPAIVFLNGEFWGLYNLQEKYSEDYIQSHYGVDEDNVILIKKDKLEEGEESDSELYDSFLKYAMIRNIPPAYPMRTPWFMIKDIIHRIIMIIPSRRC